MKFSQIYIKSDKPVISFEIFPPRTCNSNEILRNTLNELATLSPDFISVTYGAMGSARNKTVEIASYIKNQLKIESACHLTCVGSNKKEIDNILKSITDAGIKNIVALRGDPPAGENSFVAEQNGYSYANELVEHIREYENTIKEKVVEFGIAIAGYPEKHLEAPNLEIDLENLKKKVDAGADVIITQLFFDNKYYYAFIKKVRELGIDIPVVPGLMPILSSRQIIKFTTMCGAHIPDNLKSQLENAADNDAYVEELGIKQCINQAQELLEYGAPGIHFYVLNKSSHIKRILNSVI